MHFAKAGWFGCGLSCRGCYYVIRIAAEKKQIPPLRYGMTNKTTE